MDGLISCQQGCWDAARQPSRTIAELHSWLPNTFCATHPLHCTNLHRLGAGFEVIIPKLIQNKRVFSRHVTPCCTETTLGVSKSNSVLGVKLKAACWDVKPEPPNHHFSHNIYVTLGIHTNIVVEFVFQPFPLYQTQQRNSPTGVEAWCGVNDKLVNVSICCTPAGTAALCNRSVQTWLFWKEQKECMSCLVLRSRAPYVFFRLHFRRRKKMNGAVSKCLPPEMVAGNEKEYSYVVLCRKHWIQFPKSLRHHLQPLTPLLYKHIASI